MADACAQALSRLAAGWEALRQPIWLFDARTLRGIYANPAALALWSADSLDELLARDFSGLSPAVLARTHRLAQATRDGGELAEPWTFYPRGRPVTVHATISTIELTDIGPVLLFEAAREDVEPEERRAVEALRHTTTLISLFDADGRALFANPAVFAVYGRIEPAFGDRFADPDEGMDILQRAVAGESLSEVRRTTTLAGGRWHHLEARQVLDPVTGAPCVLLNETDVTARVDAEAARAAAEQRAAMALARQQFLTHMSHELRTPLNAVIGFAELLMRDAAPEQAEPLRHIQVGGTRLLSVVNQMIELPDDVAIPAPEMSDPPPPQAAEPLSEPAGRPLQVLYVDDNASNRALVTAMLEAIGVRCSTAQDGREGVATAERGGWDLILMDIQMPVMDGVAATRAIRAGGGASARVPIVALTANTQPAEVAAYRAAGMNDCLGKPVELASLCQALELWTAAGAQRAA